MNVATQSDEESAIVPPIPGIFTENKVPMKMADWVLVYKVN